MRKALFLVSALLISLSTLAQTDPFEEYRKAFDQFKNDKQAEYDAYRKSLNDQYAEFLRQAWETFTTHPADEPEKEEMVPPVIYEDPSVPTQDEAATAPEPTPEQAPEQAPIPQEETPLAKQPKAQEAEQTPEAEQAPEPEQAPAPLPKVDPLKLPTITPITVRPKKVDPKPIPVQPTVVVVPAPTPAPEPIAPVQPKPEEKFKRETIAYYGTPISIAFPLQDDLKLKKVNENGVADAWKEMADSKYDITVKTAIDARKANALCDWSYLDVLRNVTEKHYGQTNEAVLMQAYLMTQSGYRIRMGMADDKLVLLIASLYHIYGMRYVTLDGTKYYIFGKKGDAQLKMCKAKFEKEQSLSLQIANLPKLSDDQTPRRTLTSKRGVTAVVSVNKNMLNFFEKYPKASINGDFGTRWAAFANTPLEPEVKAQLYPPLKKTIAGMSERDAVGILLNWVQTAFVYGYDDEIWGGDRPFFAQETLYYPYSDCEDRAILFSRLVRDLVGLDVVLLYYPGHLATAVAFNGQERGDWLTYQQRKYIVCDPTYINAGVGMTMPGMDNKEAKVIILK